MCDLIRKLDAKSCLLVGAPVFMNCTHEFNIDPKLVANATQEGYQANVTCK